MIPKDVASENVHRFILWIVTKIFLSDSCMLARMVRCLLIVHTWLPPRAVWSHSVQRSRCYGLEVGRLHNSWINGHWVRVGIRYNNHRIY